MGFTQRLARVLRRGAEACKSDGVAVSGKAHAGKISGDAQAATIPSEARTTTLPAGFRAINEWRHKKFKWSDVSHVRLIAATAVAGVLLIGGSCVAVDRIQTTGNWVQVFTNGSYVGMVPNEASVMDSMERVASGYGVDVHFHPVHTHVSDTFNWHAVASLPTPAIAIKYNGKTLLYTKSQADAKRVLSDVKAALTPKGLSQGATVKLAGTVQLTSAVVSVSSILNPMAAVHYILNPSGKQLPGRSEGLADVRKAAQAKSPIQAARMPAYLTVAASLPVGTGAVNGTGQAAGVSGTNGTTTTSVPNGINGIAAAGTKLTSGLNAAARTPAPKAGTTGPLIQVKAQEKVTKSVSVPFPVHYVKDAHLGVGAVKVATPGKTGKVQEQVLVTYVNGTKAKEEVLKKTVLQAPQAEVADKGTNAGVASGSWGWPTNAYDITSGFGARILRGYHDFHPGVDIGVPIGSPVYATNNGVVLQAGWNSGGYGNWVLINNGNGIETVFGHMSHVDVHAGQTVAKGDLLGLSGDTGNVTGPHLHYEVRVNGTAVPPQKYM